ncbi:toll/interleukin-1 receptor domain-containing protein [Nitrospira sp. CMX1]
MTHQPEFAVTNIITSNDKEIPQDTLIKVGLGSVPGTVSIHVQLPGQNDWRVYTDLPIVGGKVVLPVKLVFLCHAKEDVSFVRNLAAKLLQDGFLCWFDEKALLPGDHWKSKIDRAIDQSDFVIVFLSSNSVNKIGYVQREIKYALEKQKLRPEGARYIIPLIINDCKIPMSFEDIHWLRVEPNEEWYLTLKTSLDTH